MSVYLGVTGGISLQRSGSATYTSAISAASVAGSRLQLAIPNTTFVTGDLVRIQHATGGTLDFIDGYASSSWLGYVNSDLTGGIRLYDTWIEALGGKNTTSVTLVDPASTYNITLTAQDQAQRSIGHVLEYEFSVSRDSQEITAIGEVFRDAVSTTVAGEGQITCHWDYYGDDGNETPNYLHHLIMRQQEGSKFSCVLMIKNYGQNAIDSSDGHRDAGLFYVFNALVKEVGMSFTPADSLQTQISFETIGQIDLLYGRGDALLTEAGDKLLQENEGWILKE